MKPQNDDADLRRLSLGHYAAAALTLLAGVFYAGFFAVMRRLFQEAAARTNAPAQPAGLEGALRLMEIAQVTNAVYFVLITVGLISVGVLTSRRRAYGWCLGLSVLNATTLAYFWPLGPVAAAFTFGLLRRASIQARFADNGFPEGTETRREWDLRASALAFYVLAAYTALGSVAGAVVMNGMTHLTHASQNAAPPLIGTLMMGFIVIGAVTHTTAFGALGYLFSSARHWGVCVALAIVILLKFPVGTATGVLSLVLLSRPEVRAMFNGVRGSRSSNGASS